MPRAKGNKPKRRLGAAFSTIVAFILMVAAVYGCSGNTDLSMLNPQNRHLLSNSVESSYDLSSIPEYEGNDYIILNEGIPQFSEDDLKRQPFEEYSPLDRLGRCGQAFALLGLETMPQPGEKRENIRDIRPSGWHQAFYDFLKQEYLYSRSHLIAWQLAAENANERNLITGTYYMNADIMLNFENGVRSYIKATGNHVLYRVTPDFRGNEQVARGVQIEAFSVEDNGAGICMNVYCYNVQPGVIIDYKTGRSWAE